MSNIEWSEIKECRNVVQGKKGVVLGFVGGLTVCSIMACGKNGKNNLTLTFMHDVYKNIYSFEAARSQADKLLAEWDKKRGLMPVPESCDKCGNRGYYYSGAADNTGHADRTPCWKCRNNPISVFNFLNTIKGE